MSKDIWNQHFKIVGNIQTIDPVDFNDVKGDINANAGKLVILKNVTFANADGTQTLITGTASGGNYYQQKIDGLDNVVVRTSSYADFASMILPYNTETNQKVPCNITGIASRYRDTWQIMIRKISDIKVLNN